MQHDKKNKQPISYHKIPQECWKNVSVNLSGPIPSSKPIVVVQGITSRCP